MAIETGINRLKLARRRNRDTGVIYNTRYEQQLGRDPPRRFHSIKVLSVARRRTQFSFHGLRLSNCHTHRPSFSARPKVRGSRQCTTGALHAAASAAYVQ